MSSHRRDPRGLDPVAALVPFGSGVLDLGCGDGALLQRLTAERGCHGSGIEIDDAAILACVAKGLNVVHGDLEQGLAEHGDQSVDVVILNQSVQQLRNVDPVLQDALRVGRKVLVGFPNFGHWRVRLEVFFRGRTPVTPGLPYQWYETPNVHFFSLEDFEAWCALRGVTVLKRVCLDQGHRRRLWPNLLARDGVYLVERRRGA
jgi:methionine biosynthesis protein MetW